MIRTCLIRSSRGRPPGPSIRCNGSVSMNGGAGRLGSEQGEADRPLRPKGPSGPDYDRAELDAESAMSAYVDSDWVPVEASCP